MTPQQKHTELWKSMVIKDRVVSEKDAVTVADVPAMVKQLVDKIMAKRDRYQAVSGTFKNPIRWYHVAIIHNLECSLDFTKYLGNGQSLYQKTTIVPIGRGPFKDFEEGAIDALRLQKLDLEMDWSIGNTLYLLEGYNGYGYSRYRGINSPYLYSGSNHYQKGKYVSDGNYDSNAVSAQIGAALLLKEIATRLNLSL